GIVFTLDTSTGSNLPPQILLTNRTIVTHGNRNLLGWPGDRLPDEPLDLSSPVHPIVALSEINCKRPCISAATLCRHRCFSLFQPLGRRRSAGRLCLATRRIFGRSLPSSFCIASVV